MIRFKAIRIWLNDITNPYQFDRRSSKRLEFSFGSRKPPESIKFQSVKFRCSQRSSGNRVQDILTEEASGRWEILYLEQRLSAVNLRILFAKERLGERER